MNNICPECPFIQNCEEKVAVRLDHVGRLEIVINELVAQELDHDIRAYDLALSLPKNWLKRLSVKDNIAIEKVRAHSVYEKSRLYQEAQQRHIDAIGDLLGMANEAPKTCSGPSDHYLGILACTSEF
jgi:hypothetical protein